jgi:hypothetical protein
MICTSAMNKIVFIRAAASVIAAIGLSLGQGIHDDMKPWEWGKFAALALGSGCAALGGFLDTSFGRLWHKDPSEPPTPDQPPSGK